MKGPTPTLSRRDALMLCLAAGLEGAVGGSAFAGDSESALFDPRTLDSSNTGCHGPLADSADIETTADGQVLQNLSVKGRVTVRHRNVTIRNCRVVQPDYYAIFAPDDKGADISGLVVESCTISGAVNGIAGKGTFRRNDIFQCDNGINVWGPSLIVENYIHDLGGVLSNGAGHNDGIENNGSGMTVLRNRIEASVEHDTSAIMTNNEFGALTDILIEGNYLAGGQYTLYCDGKKSERAVANFKVVGNVVRAGRYGPYSFSGRGAAIRPSRDVVLRP